MTLKPLPPTTVTTQTWISTLNGKRGTACERTTYVPVIVQVYYHQQITSAPGDINVLNNWIGQPFYCIDKSDLAKYDVTRDIKGLV